MIIIGALLVTAASVTAGIATPPILQPEVWVNAAWAGHGYGDVVDADGHVFGVNATDTISNGSGMVAIYGRVNVAPGNYPESVLITTPMVLNGSKSGVPGNDSSRGTGEAVIGGVSSSGGYTYGITIHSDDVVVDGLTVTGYDIGIIATGAGEPVNNVTIINSCVLNSAVTGIDASATDSRIAYNLVNTTDTSGTDIKVDSTGGAATTVEGNLLETFGTGINYIGDGGHILGNVLATTGFMNGIVYDGSNGVISENTIDIPGASSTAGTVTPTGFISVEGDGVQITDNIIGKDGGWGTPRLVGVFGNNSIIADNILHASYTSMAYGGTIGDGSAIYVYGDNSSVSENTVKVDTCDNSTILLKSQTPGQDVGSVTVNIITVKTLNHGSIIEVLGEGSTISGNTIASAKTITGISAIGDDSTISGNTIGDASNPDIFSAIRFVGDSAAVTCNNVRVGTASADYLVYGEGDNALFAHNNVEYFSANNTVGIFGDNNNVSYNDIGDVWFSLSASAGVKSVSPEYGVIYYEGDGAVIKNNEIGGEFWNYHYGIAVKGNGAAIDDNDLTGSISDRAIDLQSTSDTPVGEINGNTIEANGLVVGIYCTGDAGTIDGNTLMLTDVKDRFIDYYGDFGVINGNSITGMSTATYCTGNDIISYVGVNGNITKNVMIVTGVMHNVIQYGDESMYLASADAQQFPNYAGTISDNTLNAAFVEEGAFIDYFGDAGKIQRNKDMSRFGFEWPLVTYRAALFGHGVITDNVGGTILYMGDQIPLAPYGTISNNHVTSTYVGIAAIGDYNVIDHNEINATVGTYTLGTKVLVDSNNFTAIPQPVSVPIFGTVPLSAGALFDGDLCKVNANTLDNFSFGVANVGLFKVVNIYTNDAVSTKYTDQVNGTLDDSAAKIAALSSLAKNYVAGKYASAGEGAPAKSLTALDSLGYRGYGNTISGNTLNYDDSMGIVGIVTLGYDFVVDSNEFNCVNDSNVLAGMIVGGDGGKVTNNELSNITLLGMYYGGLLKFENGIYTTDLLGMNANITGNTIDNRGTDSCLAGLFPWGIVFTGYDAMVKDNDLFGIGLGILTVQFEGAITNNKVDTFNDDAMALPFDQASIKPLEGEVVSGLGGIVSVCNNLTVTDNFVNGTLIGMLFVPIDPYTTWGNAYVDNNVLTNNMFQMAFVPSYFMFHMNDSSVKPIDTATMLEVMDRNPMDRAVYDTNALGEYCVLPLIKTGYFNISAAGVYSDIQLGVIFADICDGTTVNVRPGIYSLDHPICVPVDELTIVGNVTAPATTVVDTGMIPFCAPDKNAFDVQGNNVTIKGFDIRNSNNTFADKDYGMNSGISVGWMGPSSVSVKPMPYLVYGGVFENNTFTNLTTGVLLDSCMNNSILYNRFANNSVGVNLTENCYPNYTEIHYNDFVGNVKYAVNNRNSFVNPEALVQGEMNLWVNATYNWWNSYQGPHDVTDPASTSTGDNITYYVLYEPWLTKPVFSTLYTYHLVPGWNLISVPLDVPDPSITGFFPASVRSGLVDIWGWNESKQDWTYYSPNPADPFYGMGYEHLLGLKSGHGYWVEMTTEAYFVIEGSAPADPALVPEWNLVGPTGICASTPEVLYSGCVDVWGWNATKQDWVYYSPNPSDPFYGMGYEHLTSVDPGHGYWVEMPI